MDGAQDRVMSVEYSGAGVLELMASAKNYNRFLADLVERALRGSQTCLDFGAGDGTMTRLVAERGLRPACVEQDAGFRERLRAGGFDARAAVTDFAPGSIEGAYSLNVLEHIEDDLGALRALRAAMVPGGRMLIYVPAFPVLFSAMDRLVGHVRRYRRAELAAKLAAAGFVVERIAHADSLGFFAALVFRLLARGEGLPGERSIVLYDRLVFPLSRLLDRVTGGLIGKNLFAVARAPL